MAAVPGGVPFRYGEFYAYCRAPPPFCEPHEAGDVHVLVATAAGPPQPQRGMRLPTRAAGPPEPFLERHYAAHRVREGDPLLAAHPGFAPLGAWVAFVRRGGGEDRRKWVLVVKPSVAEMGELGPVALADHYTFVLNPKSADGRALNLHWTSYQPDRLAPEQGRAHHDPCHLPAAFELPRAAEGMAALLAGRVAKRDAGALLALLSSPETRPVGGQADATEEAAAPQAGGSRGRRRRRKGGRAAATFAEVFTELPVTRLTMIALPSAGGGEGCDVTAVFDDRMRHTDPRTGRRVRGDVAVAFRLHGPYDPEAAKAGLVKALRAAGVTCAAFADPPATP